jgi:hypothetical protein
MNDEFELIFKLILLRLLRYLSICSSLKIFVVFVVALKYKMRASAFSVELVDVFNVMSASNYFKGIKQQEVYDFISYLTISF